MRGSAALCSGRKLGGNNRRAAVRAAPGRGEGYCMPDKGGKGGRGGEARPSGHVGRVLSVKRTRGGDREGGGFGKKMQYM